MLRDDGTAATPAATDSIATSAEVSGSAGTPIAEAALKPMPYAQVAVESETVNTIATADADGWFSIEVPETDTVTIKSAAKALKFLDINGNVVEELSGVASTLSTQNPFYIKSESQIKQGAMCQFTQGGQAYVRFPYTQRTGETLDVPAGSRNYLVSDSGTQLPVEEFAHTAPNQLDNTTSFSRPLSEFTAPNGTLTLEWYLYGSLAPRQDPLPICEGSGELNDCTAITISGLDRVFGEVSKAASDISKRILSSRARISFSGKTRVAFYQRRVAPSLAQLRRVLNSVPRTGYVCPVQPSSCTSRTIPKKEMLQSLEFLFRTKWPREIKPIIKSINKLAPPARKRLQALLSQYPDKITTCNGQ